MSEIRPQHRTVHLPKGQPDGAKRTTIFAVATAWNSEASVWPGHCDDIPGAADAAAPDELLTKISSMARDLLPDNHPSVDPANVYL